MSIKSSHPRQVTDQATYEYHFVSLRIPIVLNGLFIYRSQSTEDANSDLSREPFSTIGIA